MAVGRGRNESPTVDPVDLLAASPIQGCWTPGACEWRICIDATGHPTQIKPRFFATDGLDSNPGLRESHAIKQRQTICVSNHKDVWVGRLHLLVYGNESIGG